MLGGVFSVFNANNLSKVALNVSSKGKLGNIVANHNSISILKFLVKLIKAKNTLGYNN